MKTKNFYAFAYWYNGMTDLLKGKEAKELYHMRECGTTRYMGSTYWFDNHKKALKAFHYCQKLVEEYNNNHN